MNRIQNLSGIDESWFLQQEPLRPSDAAVEGIYAEMHRQITRLQVTFHDGKKSLWAAATLWEQRYEDEGMDALQARIAANRRFIDEMTLLRWNHQEGIENLHYHTERYLTDFLGGTSG